MPNADRRLSENALPLPVVLVVGDARSYFSIEAWKGVVAAYDEATNPEGDADPASGATPKTVGDPKPDTDGDPAGATKRRGARELAPITWDELEPVLAVPHEESPRELEEREWEPRRRVATRRPVPLQLTHEHETDWAGLEDDIRRIADLFDVWGIIASASAGQVEPVRKALRGVDIPLLVTTDSTTVRDGEQPANELRLMPSNRAQARTMLANALLATKVDRPHRPDITERVLLGLPRIAYSRDLATHAREYVQDLLEELSAEAARLNLPPLHSYDERHDYDGPLIVIGYTPHAEHLLTKRGRGRLTILSDGCATKRVYDAVDVQLEPADAAFWLITRPHLTLENLGRQAYSAIAEAGAELLTSEPTRRLSGDGADVSRRDRIKQILHETDATHFEFDGIENVAIAYRVVPVANQQDLRTATPPERRSTDRRGDRDLHLVGGTAVEAEAS
jgi:hypothetical protein